MLSDEKKIFEETALPHFEAAYNLARWLTRDDHAAEDVVQESFVRAARYFHSFRGGSAKAWLLGVVRRASLDWLAKRQAQAAEPLNDVVSERDDQAADPVYLVIRKCDRETVRAALDELPPPLREAIVLRELDGMSYQEIAAVAEVPIGTVMSRISRGRERLQRRLAAYAEENVP